MIDLCLKGRTVRGARLKTPPQTPSSPARSQAFSVVEMLIVIAVLSVMAASVIAFYGRYHRDVLLKVRNQRNAQEITALAMGASAAGATVIEPGDMEGTIRNLMEGRKGTLGTFKGRIFRISQLSDEEIEGAMQHLNWRDGFPAYTPDPD